MVGRSSLKLSVCIAICRVASGGRRRLSSTEGVDTRGSLVPSRHMPYSTQMFVEWAAKAGAQFVESLPIVPVHLKRIADEATLWSQRVGSRQRRAVCALVLHQLRFSTRFRSVHARDVTSDSQWRTKRNRVAGSSFLVNLLLSADRTHGLEPLFVVGDLHQSSIPRGIGSWSRGSGGSDGAGGGGGCSGVCSDSRSSSSVSGHTDRAQTSAQSLHVPCG